MKSKINIKDGENMSIQYYKLWDLLNRRKMKKTDLKAIISSKTLAKLSKGENVTTDVIADICWFLDCQPGDIMEWEDRFKDMTPEEALNTVPNNVNKATVGNKLKTSTRDGRRIGAMYAKKKFNESSTNTMNN